MERAMEALAGEAEGMDEDSPHSTVSKIAADLFQTILAIQASDQKPPEFRILRCRRAKCRRWVVAKHDGREYCSDNCRKAHFLET